MVQLAVVRPAPNSLGALKIIKMGVSLRGGPPEVSPLLRAEDGRGGTGSTRDTTGRVAHHDDEVRNAGILASTCSRVTAAVLVLVLVLGLLVSYSTGGSLALSSRDPAAVAVPEQEADTKHGHREGKGVALKEVFVVLGADEDGPTGRWLRVDEDTKTTMEAAAKAKREAKRAKKEAKAHGHVEESATAKHHKHQAASGGDASLGDFQSDDLTMSSEGDADKLAKYKDELAAYKEGRAMQSALAKEAGQDLPAKTHQETVDENAVHVVQHPTTPAQLLQLENLRNQERNVAEVEKAERAWAAQQKEEYEATEAEAASDALGLADAASVGEKESDHYDGETSQDVTEKENVNPANVWQSVDLDPAHASCASSLREPAGDGLTKAGSLFDAGPWFDNSRADGDPGTGGDFGPRARAIRDTTFVSSLYLGAARDEDVTVLLQAAKDTACNAGRARLNFAVFADDDTACQFVKAHYVAGRSASDFASNNGPTPTDPASPMPRLGGGRFSCVVRKMDKLPLQPPSGALSNPPDTMDGTCGANAKARAPGYNKANFVVEAADTARAGDGAVTKNYAWVDIDHPGPGLLKALLEHPYDVSAMGKMPTRVHFGCHAEQRRKALDINPCRARGGFVAPKLFVGTEHAMRAFAKRWANYARAYVPLEETKMEWRYASGYFTDYTAINAKNDATQEDDDETETLIETPIVANGETGAWSCPCPTEDFLVNRLWNDELFPEENLKNSIDETAKNWGGEGTAVAAVGKGYALAPGLALMARDVGGASPMGKVSVAALGAYTNNDPARNWSIDHEVAASLVSQAAAMAGAQIVAEYGEGGDGMDDKSVLEDGWARMTESNSAAAERLAREELERRANKPEGEAPIAKKHITPEENKRGSLMDALEDTRDAQCARLPDKPTSFAELPSMGLKKWHF